MENREFAKELEERTKQFAIRIITLASHLPPSPEAKVIRYQLTRCGTSIGANYREANRAVSRADFKNRISICEKEASETQYWLEIVRESGLVAPQQVEADHRGEQRATGDLHIHRTKLEGVTWHFAL